MLSRAVVNDPSRFALEQMDMHIQQMATLGRGEEQSSPNASALQDGATE